MDLFLLISSPTNFSENISDEEWPRDLTDIIKGIYSYDLKSLYLNHRSVSFTNSAPSLNETVVPLDSKLSGVLYLNSSNARKRKTE